MSNSDNPLSGYSDAQALRLLWDMATAVRLELEAAKQRIQELELENETLRDKLAMLLAGDSKPEQMLVDAIRELRDGALTDSLELAFNQAYWDAIDLVGEWLEAARKWQ